MSYDILTVCHSGSSLLSSSDQASQYGDSDVAATAIPGVHFVCAGYPFGRLAAPGLPLSATGPKQPQTPSDAGAKEGLHSQSAPPIDSGGAHPLPPAATADQSRGGRGVATVVGTSLSRWLRTKPKGACNAF